MRAWRKARARLAEAKFDLASYDLICLGTPVWAFAPAPAMNTYLDKCSGIAGKEVILFCTTGGTGAERCLDYMYDILCPKGAKGLKRFSITQSQIRNSDAVLAKIKAVL